MLDYTWTYGTHPEAWDDGVSWLVKARFESGWHVWASGWYNRMLRFEHPDFSFDDGECGECLFKHLPFDPTCFEQYVAEFSLDERNLEQSRAVLAHLVGVRLADSIVDICTSVTRVSANRRVSLPGIDAHAEALMVNMPARNGNSDERLRCIKRWCHIFKIAESCVIVYSPLSEEMKQQLRWPHNAVYLNRPKEWYQCVDEGNASKSPFDSEVLLPIRYLEYNMKNWTIERELLETQVFLASDEESLKRCKADFRQLAVFMSYASLSIRSMRRRSLDANRGYFSQHAELRKEIENRISDIGSGIESARSQLIEDNGLISSTAQTLQAQASDRLNQLLELVSAVFLTPSLIISFFSMNILTAEQTTGWYLSIIVFLLCIIAALVMLVLLRRERR